MKLLGAIAAFMALILAVVWFSTQSNSPKVRWAESGDTCYAMVLENWEMSLGMTVNNTPYVKVEVEPGRWEWQIDRAAEKRMAEENQHRRDLYRALKTRVLTDEEWEEVLRYGDLLNIEPGVPYFPDEESRQLNDAYLQQMRLRLEASK